MTTISAGSFDNPAVDSPGMDRSDVASHIHAVMIVDAAVYLLIIVFGMLQFFLYQRAQDFYTGDTAYFELARSLHQNGTYGFDFKPETMLPPGFSFLVALICGAFGWTHAVAVRAMTVFCTLGFLATYAFLRREYGRGIAAAVALVLMSSPAFFGQATRYVFSDLAYFFTSMAGLYFAARLDAARWRSTGLAAAAGLFLVGSLVIRSAGLTLFAGMAVWLALTAYRDPQLIHQRLKKFLPILIAAIVVQAGWTVWGHRHENPPEWPIGGWPRSYSSQLLVKNGNIPELGNASASDIPVRIERNLSDRAVDLVQIVVRRGYRRLFLREWFSPWVVAPTLFILVGLIRSIRPAGGTLCDWYFIGHEAMYLVWPWTLEERFILPVVPLACAYLWRGAESVLKWMRRDVRGASAWTFAIAVVCGALTIADGRNGISVQVMLAALCWTAVAFASLAMGLSSPRRPILEGVHRRTLFVHGWRVSASQTAAAALLFLLVLSGLALQLQLGIDNVRFDVTRDSAYPPIEAAKWIRAQTSADAIVMARQLDVVYHYTDRKIVWFPPVSNPRLLMEGIRRHRVQYIIVPARIGDSYWEPQEEDCFEPLQAAFPKAFRLVHTGPNERTFEVVGIPSA
jgi:hypothetical protein